MTTCQMAVVLTNPLAHPIGHCPECIPNPGARVNYGLMQRSQGNDLSNLRRHSLASCLPTYLPPDAKDHRETKRSSQQNDLDRIKSVRAISIQSCHSWLTLDSSLPQAMSFLPAWSVLRQFYGITGVDGDTGYGVQKRTNSEAMHRVS